MIAMLAVALALDVSQATPPPKRAAYVARGDVSGFQPDLRQSIAERLKVDLVDAAAPSVDSTVTYIPTEVAEDVCRSSGLPLVVSVAAFTSSPNGPNTTAVTLAVSEYDCAQHSFVKIAQAVTSPVTNGRQSAMNEEYRSALKRLLNQLAPPPPGTNPGNSTGSLS